MFILTFILGAIGGGLAVAIVAGGTMRGKLQDAFRKGYEAGMRNK